MTDDQTAPDTERAERLAAQLRSNADAHHEEEGTERRRAADEITRLTGLLAERDATVRRVRELARNRWYGADAATALTDRILLLEDVEDALDPQEPTS